MGKGQEQKIGRKGKPNDEDIYRNMPNLISSQGDAS